MFNTNFYEANSADYEEFQTAIAESTEDAGVAKDTAIYMGFGFSEVEARKMAIQDKRDIEAIPTEEILKFFGA